MSTGEDESSSGLNGRLRPRKSITTIPSPLSKPTRKTEDSLAHNRRKRNTPSKSSPSKPDDLASKSDSLTAPTLLCPYCDREFASKQAASKHARRIHLSSPRQDHFIDCLFCTHSEAEPNGIIKHMVDSHPNQYFACLDCQTRFPSTSEFTQHKLSLCEKQKPAYRSKLRQKQTSGSKKKQKVLKPDEKGEVSRENKEHYDDHGFNGIVISCEPKASQVHDATDIEDNITTNVILPPNKTLGSTGMDKSAVIVLDDIQWNKRIPPNFSFHNTDADQILSRLGVVHRSPRVGETTRRELFRILDESNQKFEKCFDTGFYAKVAKNVQENIAKYLDGSFNFNPNQENFIKTRKSKARVVINTAEGFPILLAFEQYSRSIFDSYMPRTIAPKHKWKWDTENAKNAVMLSDATKRDNHVNNCIITLVSSLDIWTQLRMRRKFEEVFKNTPTAKKTEKQNMISMELKEILESREIPTCSSQIVKSGDVATVVKEESELPSYLGLSPSQLQGQLQPAVLSGEWVRPRCYVCCACGAQTRDGRELNSHITTQHPNAQVQHYEIVGEPLLSADILKHLYVPPVQISNRTRPPRGFRDCTKCKKSITLEDLHQHMLDCAGDTPTVRRKCRNRPFNVRKRRTRLPDNTIRQKMRKDIRARHRQKAHMRARPRIRTEVGDAETIRKMIADLPAKRNRNTNTFNANTLRPRKNINTAKINGPNKLRATEDRKNIKARAAKKISKLKPKEPPKNQTGANTSLNIDEDDQPLKLSAKRALEKTTHDKEALPSRATTNRTRKKHQSDKKQSDMYPYGFNIYSAYPPYAAYAMYPPAYMPPNQLPIENAPQRIDVNKAGPSNVRKRSNRGHPNKQNDKDQQPPAGEKDGNENKEKAQIPSVPLKHSIARLTSETNHWGSTAHFHHSSSVPQVVHSAQRVASDCRHIFENEAAADKFDKPPLPIEIKEGSESGDQPKDKSKSNKPRKGLNDCIAMLKNKFAATGQGSAQCGDDEPMDPDPPIIVSRLSEASDVNLMTAQVYSRSVLHSDQYRLAQLAHKEQSSSETRGQGKSSDERMLSPQKTNDDTKSKKSTQDSEFMKPRAKHNEATVKRKSTRTRSSCRSEYEMLNQLAPHAEMERKKNWTGLVSMKACNAYPDNALLQMRRNSYDGASSVIGDTQPPFYQNRMLHRVNPLHSFNAAYLHDPRANLAEKTESDMHMQLCYGNPILPEICNQPRTVNPTEVTVSPLPYDSTPCDMQIDTQYTMTSPSSRRKRRDTKKRDSTSDNELEVVDFTFRHSKTPPKSTDISTGITPVRQESYRRLRASPGVFFETNNKQSPTPSPSSEVTSGASPANRVRRESYKRVLDTSDTDANINEYQDNITQKKMFKKSSDTFLDDTSNLQNLRRHSIEIVTTRSKADSHDHMTIQLFHELNEKDCKSMTPASRTRSETRRRNTPDDFTIKSYGDSARTNTELHSLNVAPMSALHEPQRLSSKSVEIDKTNDSKLTTREIQDSRNVNVEESEYTAPIYKPKMFSDYPIKDASAITSKLTNQELLANLPIGDNANMHGPGSSRNPGDNVTHPPFSKQSYEQYQSHEVSANICLLEINTDTEMRHKQIQPHYETAFSIDNANDRPSSKDSTNRHNVLPPHSLDISTHSIQINTNAHSPCDLTTKQHSYVSEPNIDRPLNMHVGNDQDKEVHAYQYDVITRPYSGNDYNKIANTMASINNESSEEIAPLDLSGNTKYVVQENTNSCENIPLELTTANDYDTYVTLDLSNKNSVKKNVSEIHNEDSNIIVDLSVKSSERASVPTINLTDENDQVTNLSLKQYDDETATDLSIKSKRGANSSEKELVTYNFLTQGSIDKNEGKDHRDIESTPTDLSRSGSTAEYTTRHVSVVEASLLSTKPVAPLGEISMNTPKERVSQQQLTCSTVMSARSESSEFFRNQIHNVSSKYPYDEMSTNIPGTCKTNSLPHGSSQSTESNFYMTRPLQSSIVNTTINRLDNMQEKLPAAIYGNNYLTMTLPVQSSRALTETKHEHISQLANNSPSATTTKAMDIQNTINDPVNSHNMDTYRSLQNKPQNAHAMNLLTTDVAVPQKQSLESKPDEVTSQVHKKDVITDENSITIEPDIETAKKIALLPKELVEILGNMPKDHRNQLLNVLPQYVSTSISTTTENSSGTKVLNTSSATVTRKQTNDVSLVESKPVKIAAQTACDTTTSNDLNRLSVNTTLSPSSIIPKKRHSPSSSFGRINSSEAHSTLPLSRPPAAALHFTQDYLISEEIKSTSSSKTENLENVDCTEKIDRDTEHFIIDPFTGVMTKRATDVFNAETNAMDLTEETTNPTDASIPFNIIARPLNISAQDAISTGLVKTKNTNEKTASLRAVRKTPSTWKPVHEDKIVSIPRDTYNQQPNFTSQKGIDVSSSYRNEPGGGEHNKNNPGMHVIDSDVKIALSASSETTSVIEDGFQAKAMASFVTTDAMKYTQSKMAANTYTTFATSVIPLQNVKNGDEVIIQNQTNPSIAQLNDLQVENNFTNNKAQDAIRRKSPKSIIAEGAVQEFNQEYNSFLGPVKSTSSGGGNNAGITKSVQDVNLLFTSCKIDEKNTKKILSAENENSSKAFLAVTVNDSIITNKVDEIGAKQAIHLSSVPSKINERKENLSPDSSQHKDAKQHINQPLHDEISENCFVSSTETIHENSDTLPDSSGELPEKNVVSDDDSEDDITLAVIVKQKQREQPVITQADSTGIAIIDSDYLSKSKKKEKKAKKKGQKRKASKVSYLINSDNTLQQNHPKKKSLDEDLKLERKEVSVNKQQTSKISKNKTPQEKSQNKDECDLNKENNGSENLNKIKDDDNILPEQNLIENMDESQINESTDRKSVDRDLTKHNLITDPIVEKTTEPVDISCNEVIKDVPVNDTLYESNIKEKHLPVKQIKSKQKKKTTKKEEEEDEKTEKNSSNSKTQSAFVRETESDQFRETEPKPSLQKYNESISNKTDYDKILKDEGNQSDASDDKDLVTSKESRPKYVADVTTTTESHDNCVGALELCSEVRDVNVLSLRRSRRGKSLYVDSSSKMEHVFQTENELKTHLTKKQLIFSKLLHDEDNHSIQQTNVIQDQHNSAANEQHISDVSVDAPCVKNEKPTKRKKSPILRRKTKKKKSTNNSQNDDEFSDVSNTHTVSENSGLILRELPNAENKIESKQICQEDVKNSTISNKIENSSSSLENTTVVLKDTIGNEGDAILVKQTSTSVKRRSNSATITDSEGNVKSKKVRYNDKKAIDIDYNSEDENKSDKIDRNVENIDITSKPNRSDDIIDKACDKITQQNLESANMMTEIRMACYNRPVASIRARSSSLSLKNPENYDPYDIDLEDDMVEVAEPIIKKKNRNSNSHVSKIAQESKVDKIKLSSENGGCTQKNNSIDNVNDNFNKTIDKDSHTIIDDYNSSNSDVTLQKYIQDKEELMTDSEDKIREKYDDPATTENSVSVTKRYTKKIKPKGGKKEQNQNNTANASVKLVSNVEGASDFNSNRETACTTGKDQHSDKQLNIKIACKGVDSSCEDDSTYVDQNANTNNNIKVDNNDTAKQQKKEKKNRRTLTVCSNVKSDIVTNEADQQSRSDKFLENFGFYSERKPRKSNLLASKKISETFHMQNNESDDAYFGHKERHSKKSSQNENRKSTEADSANKASQGSLKKVNKNIPKKNTFLKVVPTYCDVCKKEFQRPDNFLRHQMTLYHVSKLSEMEMKQNTIPIYEEPNYLIEYKRQILKLKKLTEKLKNQKNKSKVVLPSLQQLVANVKKIVREKYGLRSTRGLSRDEALFLDCCELLKESHKNDVVIADSTKLTSDRHNYIVQPTVSRMDVVENQMIDEHYDTRNDGDMDSITAQNIMDSEEVRNLENDLISGLKEAADASGKKSCYVTFQNATNTGVSILQREVDPNVSCRIAIEEFHENNDFSESVKKANKGKPKKQAGVKDLMYPEIEEIDLLEDKFDKIKRKSRSAAVAAKLVLNVENTTSNKSRKLPDKKSNKKCTKKNYQNAQVLTKGALKGFEGIKISIPTQDLNMPPSVSPPRQQRRRKKCTSKKKRDNKDSECSSTYDSDLNDKADSALQRDIYEFKDNEDTELLELRPSTVMDRFRSMNYKEKVKQKEKEKEKDNDKERKREKVKDRYKLKEVSKKMENEKSKEKEKKQKYSEILRQQKTEVTLKENENDMEIKNGLDNVIPERIVKTNDISKESKENVISTDDKLKDIDEELHDYDELKEDARSDPHGDDNSSDGDSDDSALPGTSCFVPDQDDDSYENVLLWSGASYVDTQEEAICTCPTDADSNDSITQRGCASIFCIYRKNNTEKNAVMEKIFKNNALRRDKDVCENNDQPKPNLDQLFDSLLESNSNNGDASVERIDSDARGHLESVSRIPSLIVREESKTANVPTSPASHQDLQTVRSSPNTQDKRSTVNVYERSSTNQNLSTLDKAETMLVEYDTNSSIPITKKIKKFKKGPAATVCADESSVTINDAIDTDVRRDVIEPETDHNEYVMMSTRSTQTELEDNRPYYDLNTLGKTSKTEDSRQRNEPRKDSNITKERKCPALSAKRKAERTDKAVNSETEDLTEELIECNSDFELDMEGKESNDFIMLRKHVTTETNCTQTDPLSHEDSSSSDSDHETLAPKHLKDSNDNSSMELYVLMSTKGTLTSNRRKSSASKYADHSSRSNSEDELSGSKDDAPNDHIVLKKYATSSSKCIQTEHTKYKSKSKHEETEFLSPPEVSDKDIASSRHSKIYDSAAVKRQSKNYNGSTRIFDYDEDDDELVEADKSSFSKPVTGKRSRSRKSDEGISTSHDYSADMFDLAGYEDAGVARQRARRKCAVGKQNVLAEHWSSESEVEGLPPRPNSADSVVATAGRKKKGRRKEGHYSGGRRGNRHAKNESRVSGSSRQVASGVGDAEGEASDGGGEAGAGAGGSRPPPGPKIRARPAQHCWSSEEEEAGGAQPQHGWIVGDSHKKLVTMLAHAKGRKRNNDDKHHFLD